jgi:site-specific recombinase XerD
MTTPTLGALVQEFFLSHLIEQKGLRQSSVRSYRDTLRLFLQFAAADAHRQVSKLTPDDLSFERVLAFLRHLEQQRRNGIAHAQPTTWCPPHVLRVRCASRP